MSRLVRYSDMVLARVRGSSSGYPGVGTLRALGRFMGMGNAKKFDPSVIAVAPGQLCRGVKLQQLEGYLEQGQIQHLHLQESQVEGDVKDVCLVSHVVLDCSPHLLSCSENIGTAALYGANRQWLPNAGAIIVMCRPAIWTDISMQARMCPQMLAEGASSVTLAKMGGDPYKDQPDYTQLVAMCDETCAVIGTQDGISFGGMLDIERFVDKIYYVSGSGRSKFGLVPTESCLIETFENSSYGERALSLEIVMTDKPEYLEILEESLIKVGKLEEGYRVLTPSDAAVLMSDLDLREIANEKAGSLGMLTISAVPKDLHGPELVEYVKSKPGIGSVLDMKGKPPSPPI